LEQKVKEVASKRLEKNITTGGRPVMLPIACSYIVRKLSPSDSVDQVFREMDQFVAARTGEAGG
jgi:hypothetical protein